MDFDLETLPQELLPWKDKIDKSFQDHVRIIAKYTEEDPGVLSSKFGGTPFLLQKDDYPCGSDQKPLILLAQINFEDVPHLNDFPKTGLLQFFVGQDDVHGQDLSHPTKQENFRIIYFPKERLIQQKTITDYPWPETPRYFPIESIFELQFEKSRGPVTCSDYRFEEKVGLKYPDGSVSDDMIELYFEYALREEHRIGGYPFFTQMDPRLSSQYKQHEILLFQMCSENSFGVDPKSEIMWGDVGVAHFFIKPEDLRNLHFSDVIYNWDCS